MGTHYRMVHVEEEMAADGMLYCCYCCVVGRSS